VITMIGEEQDVPTDYHLVWKRFEEGRRPTRKRPWRGVKVEASESPWENSQFHSLVPLLKRLPRRS
jgi:hypothetical protein